MDPNAGRFKNPEAVASTGLLPDPKKDYYTILGVSPQASHQQIKEAFFHLKNTYSQSNLALYSLTDDLELDDSLEEFKKAWEVLGDSDKRKIYDIGRLRNESSDASCSGASCSEQSGSGSVAGEAETGEAEKRHCPDQPDSGGSDAGVLGFGALSSLSSSAREPGVSSRSGHRRGGALPSFRQDPYLPSPGRGKLHGELESYRGSCSESSVWQDSLMQDGALASVLGGGALKASGVKKLVASHAMESDIQKKIQDVIESGDPGDGALFRSIRELVGVSQEEMQDNLKISIGYIKYLEENCFDLLPQEVYVKGFLKSYLRFLGVPGSDRLVTAYAERFKNWTNSKGG